MAFAMFMHWDGVTADECDQVRTIVNWEGDPPAGGQMHIAAVDEGGLHITDRWDSAEEFQAFVANRLMPGVMQVGIKTEPKVTVLPVHAVFTPAYRPV